MRGTDEETQCWPWDIVWVLIYSTLIAVFILSTATMPV
jgi:hypothetical protein